MVDSTQRGPIIVPRNDLVGRQVVMRPNHPSFCAQLHAAAMESLATVGRWMAWCHPDRKVEEGLEWYRGCERDWNEGVAYEFSTFSPDGEYLGGAGLNQFNRVHNFANLGYWVRESRQRRGIAVEAARLLSTFGFEVLGLDRIEIVAAVDNLPSRRVAEKAGAQFEGIGRRRLLLRGKAIDAAVYSLVPDASP